MAINELFAANRYQIILDFSKLSYISREVADILANVCNRVRENNGQMVILNPKSNVEEYLNFLGLAEKFKIANSREDAINFFL